ncbi:MAG: hypothetical protein RBS80_16270, partial [Thermoguttaceae bacterium]|nr:hypothetical protein [Thermoguttaceae bacterium]
MEHLQEQLDQLLNQVPDADAIRTRLENLVSVYPFNEYEYIISHLLAADFLSLDAYYELRGEYLARNMFLYIFEISAPRTFGESWAQGHLKGLVPDLQKPSKKLDPDYSGQYLCRCAFFHKKRRRAFVSRGLGAFVGHDVTRPD